MKIDWAALGIVAIVSIFVTLAFTALLSSGIRLVAQGTTQTTGSQAIKLAGYALLGLAGLLVLFGIYLLMPISG